MGIGMVVILNVKDVKRAQMVLKTQGLRSWPIGEVVPGEKVTMV